MKRPTTGARSYLRQLAEPIPRSSTALIPRRPGVERGVTGRHDFAGMPQILDTVDNPGAHASQQAAGMPSHRLRPGDLRNETLALRLGTEAEATATLGTRHLTATSATTRHTDLSSSPITQSGDSSTPGNTTQEKLTEPKALGKKDTAPHHSKIGNRTGDASEQPSSAKPTDIRSTAALISSIDVARAEPMGAAYQRRDAAVQVHIGTVEVRVSSPPAREPQSTRAIDPPRSSRKVTHGQAVESLARGLAWSHGLVQG
jgi:hypothetical protein